jgi:predicted DNA-binding transcriptional regulator AlpA
MKKYSIAETAELVGVDRATMYRWIQQNLVPIPHVEVIASVRITYWTEAELTKIRAYKAEHYWGQGKQRSRRGGVKKSKTS